MLAPTMVDGGAEEVDTREAQEPPLRWGWMATMGVVVAGWDENLHRRVTVQFVLYYIL